MDAESDRELLARFADTASEAAFRELVARHVDHVYSVAWRVVRSSDLAADIAQRVFVKLAQGGRPPRQEVTLSAWLHMTARSMAVDLVRAEAAQKRRETNYHQHTAMDAPDTRDWSELEPVIDAAVESLPATDRDAVLLRFYQNQSHAEVGRRLNLTEDAARMRVQRALERLRQVLARQGVTTTAAALALTLPLHAVQTAPPTLAATVTTAAASATGVQAATHSLSSTALTMTKSHLAATAAIAIALPIIALQYFQNDSLRKEAASLRSVLAAAPSPPPRVVPRDSLPPEVTASPAEGAAALSGRPSSPRSLREILAQSDPVHRIRALVEYAENLPSDEIATALQDLREGSPDWDPEAKLVMHMLLTRWAKESPDAAYASLESLDLRKQGAEGISIVASLAALDPKRAVQWLQNPDNRLVDFPFVGQILAGTIGKEWVRQDSAAALEWARNLPENQQGGAYVGVLGTLASTDPATAATLATQLESSGARRNVIGDIAEAWARKAPEAALEWARSLPGEEARGATTKALGGWAQNQPAAAAAWVDQLPASETDGALLKAVTSPWMAQAPDDAAAWLSARPEGEAKNQAMGDLMWNWTKQNPVEASTWLHDQNPGPARDAAINGLALATFDNDPEGALTWAASITDEKTRAGSIALGLAAWKKKDAAAAEAWATRSGVAMPAPENK